MTESRIHPSAVIEDGPETVRGVAAAGLAGIVIEAGGVLVLDQRTTLARAEEAGLYLWSRPAKG